MTGRASGSAGTSVLLRPVTHSDLPIFFEHQRDPVACEMAAFPARDRATFTAHWEKILADDTCITRTVEVDGEVAGNIGSWEQSGQREVGYWIGRSYWGRGIATQALSTLLAEVTLRPLYAHVAKANVASLRVLEKCGFTTSGEVTDADDQVEEWILTLSD